MFLQLHKTIKHTKSLEYACKNALFPQIIESIQQVAKDNNYDLVLSEGVLYASPKIDMSGLVIEYLKK